MDPSRAARHESVAASDSETASLTRNSIHPPWTLIAEDNEDLLQLLTRALQRDGHEVVQARNGLDLMHWVDQMTEWQHTVPLFDLIITDLRMPMFSGQDCLDRLDSCNNRTPVILISAFANSKVRRQAFAKGARAVLDKPLDMRTLRAAVELALS
jgi:CheY-like chemotaxis protein